jgi:hypothetical protein
MQRSIAEVVIGGANVLFGDQLLKRAVRISRSKQAFFSASSEEIQRESMH